MAVYLYILHGFDALSFLYLYYHCARLDAPPFGQLSHYLKLYKQKIDDTSAALWKEPAHLVLVAWIPRHGPAVRHFTEAF